MGESSGTTSHGANKVYPRHDDNNYSNLAMKDDHVRSLKSRSCGSYRGANSYKKDVNCKPHMSWAIDIDGDLCSVVRLIDTDGDLCSHAGRYPWEKPMKVLGSYQDIAWGSSLLWDKVLRLLIDENILLSALLTMKLEIPVEPCLHYPQ
jgi:hypothetical protein